MEIISKKIHKIDHVYGEGKEIPEIAYDSPRFWRREINSRNCI